MNVRALLFTTAGAVVAVFYALESVLEFQAGGVAPPLFVKVLISIIGVYVFFRNAKRIKKGKVEGPSADAV